MTGGHVHTGAGADDAHLGPGRADPAAAKRDVRRVLLARRRALPAATIAAASRSIVDALRDLPELAGRRRVLLYASDPDEVSLDALIDAPPDGWTVLLPRVVDGGLVAVAHPPGAPLVAGFRGIREPSGAPTPDASDELAIDVVLVPGVAFTPDGARLGRGAGMYDRFLARRTGTVHVGVCMETSVVADLPLESHDVAVDVLVTDASVRRRGTGGPASPP